MCDQDNTRGEGAEEQEGRFQQTDPQQKRGCDSDAWWEERSLPQKILLGIGFGIIGAGLVILFGWIVMLLWNWLMPEIFGLKELSYWQAWGLMILSCILFKGIRFPSESSRRSDKKRKRRLRRYMQEDSPIGDPPTGPAQAQT